MLKKQIAQVKKAIRDAKKREKDEHKKALDLQAVYSLLDIKQERLKL